MKRVAAAEAALFHANGSRWCMLVICAAIRDSSVADSVWRRADGSCRVLLVLPRVGGPDVGLGVGSKGT